MVPPGEVTLARSWAGAVARLGQELGGAQQGLAGQGLGDGAGAGRR